MVKNESQQLNIITPETQTVNLKGVLNNTINSGVLNSDNPENGLGNLYDVNISNLKKNDILVYNGVSWVNKNYAEPAKDYVWLLYGGNCDGFDKDGEENPDPDEPITGENYAEEALITLNNFINSTDFQDSANGISGLKSINMEGNMIYLNVDGRVNNLLEMFYNNDNINSFMGRIVNVVYDNVSYGLRNAMDEVSNDVNDNIIDWKVNNSGNSNTRQWENKVFIYFSDSSGLFLGLNVKFVGNE